MKRARLLLAAGTAAFLLALAASLPAAVALPWVAPADFRPAGVGGTLWQGSFAGAGIGPARLGPTSWRLFPPALLLGRLQASVSTRLGDAEAGGVVVLGIGNRLECRGCRYQGPVADLRTVLPALGRLEGRLELELDRLVVRGRWPARVVGTGTLAGVPLGVPGARDAPRATLAARVAADPVGDDGAIVVEVQDQGGPLELQGRVTLTPPGSFGFSGRPGPDGATGIAFGGTF